MAVSRLREAAACVCRSMLTDVGHCRLGVGRQEEDRGRENCMSDVSVLLLSGQLGTLHQEKPWLIQAYNRFFLLLLLNCFHSIPISLFKKYDILFYEVEM